MIERACPPRSRGRADRRRRSQTLLDGSRHISAARETRGNRRRERGSAAVGVPCVLPRMPELGNGRPSNNRSTTLGSSKRSPLTTVVRARATSAARRRPRPRGFHAGAEQHFGLEAVWRDDGRQREQQFAHRLDRVEVEQAATGGRDHHRVDDDTGRAERSTDRPRLPRSRPCRACRSWPRRRPGRPPRRRSGPARSRGSASRRPARRGCSGR